MKELSGRGRRLQDVPPSGGSLEIGNFPELCRVCGSTPRSPFGGIPRNWKH